MLPIPLIDALEKTRDGVALFLGAHCDDIALGAGGLLLLLQRVPVHLQRHGVVFTGGSDPIRSHEEKCAATAFGLNSIDILNYPDGDLPTHHVSILHDLQDLRATYRDRLVAVFVTNKLDRHQDHRAIAECAYRAFRDHLIIEYEIQSYDGELPHPNLYVRLDEVLLDAKVRRLLESYPSRTGHSWWRQDVFESLAIVRGVQSNTKYAEAFTVRKMVV